MKSSNYLFMTAAAVVFAACSNENDPVNDGPVAAQINAEIDGMTTRASGTVWAEGDAISVTVKSVANSGKTKGANVKYHKITNGWEVDDAPIYFEDLNEVTFSAYYPFQGTSGTSAGTISKTITADDQTAKNQPKIDFMFASGAKASKKNPIVNFQQVDANNDHRFKHCMSQLTLTFIAGTGVTLPGKLTEYTVLTVTMDGEFNTETGEAKASMHPGTSISLPLTPDKDTYTAAPLILFPQTQPQNKFFINVTVEGVRYAAELQLPVETDYQFKAGVNLTYEVTINKTGLSVGTAEIVDWETQVGTGASAEM